MKKQKRTYLIFILAFVLIISISAFVCFNRDIFSAYAMSNDYVVDSNTDFEDDNVLVILDSSVSGVNKVHDPKFFSCVEVESIKDLTERKVSKNTETEDFNQILQIYLKNKSRAYVLKAVSLLNKMDCVVCAEPNYIGSFGASTNDTAFSDQWGLDNQYGINVCDAWDITEGSRNIRVGVIDTGVSAHEDLNDNLVSGWNFVDNNSNTEDTHGHGTHVAGIIGAVGDNNIGISGVNKKVSIVPLKIANGSSWDVSEVISAINYAQNLWGTNNQIDVLNFSGWNFKNDEILKKAIDDFNGLFVCIAGNDRINIDENPNYPASFDIDNSLVVGAIDSSGMKWFYSNYGAESVDVLAPGDKILSTFPNSICNLGTCDKSAHYANGYHYMPGTSMAAPHVTGVAALLLSIDNTLSASDLKTIICDSVDKDSKLSNYCVTGGRLNAYKAVNGLKNGATISFSNNGIIDRYNTVTVKFGDTMPEVNFFAPKKEGYAFDGYYDSNDEPFYIMDLVVDKQTAKINGLEHAYLEKPVPKPGITWDHYVDTTLYAKWSTIPYECDYTYLAYCGTDNIGGGTTHLKHGDSMVSPATISGYQFDHFTYLGNDYSADQKIPVRLYRGLSGNIHLDGEIRAYYNKDSCIAQGSLITLADGRQVAVEDLTGNESLLVWNLYTGTYDSAPILFIDSDPASVYKVINLSFSDGTAVKVIYEHGLWDYDLNKYVYLDENADKYIGHWFNKGDSRVQLVGVEIKEEYTVAYSPVTYGLLCYYVNGMLSMPGGIEGLFNIFDVDTTLMKYDETSMRLDIETYGLFTYEEFTEYFYLPESAFEAFNGQYLKVAIGKGLISIDDLSALYNRYSEFLG